MTRENSFKRCRICGGDNKFDEPMCIYCGSSFQKEMMFGSTALAIVLAVLGFLVIIIFGVLSVFAIPRFIGIDSNALAASSLRNSSDSLPVLPEKKRLQE